MKFLFFALAAVPLMAIAAESSTSSTASTTASSNSTSLTTSSTKTSSSKSSSSSVSKSSATTSSSALTTTTTGLSQCIINCSNAAAFKNGCSNYTNAVCICGSSQTQFDAGYCISFFCPNDAAAAVAEQNQICGGLSISATSAPTSDVFTQTVLSLLSTPTSSTANISSTSGSSSSSTSAAATHSSGSAGIIKNSPFISLGALIATALLLSGGALGSFLVL